MSLQLALLLIGVVIVVIVAAGAFATGRRRDRPSRPTGPGGAERVPPVLTEEVSLEDRLDINPTPRLVSEARQLRSDASVAPVRKTADDQFKKEIEVLEEMATMPLDLDPGLKRARRRAPARTVMFDEHIDFLMRLPGEQAVQRDEALGVYKQYEFDIDKPHRLYGRRVETERWTELAYDSAKMRYGDLLMSLQLVDARGPVDESGLNTFSQVGLKLADALHRPTKFSHDFEQAVEKAQQLQKFCETYDVIAAINVAASEGKPGFRGRDIERAAGALGLQFGPLNVFHLKNTATPGCQHLFSLTNMIEPGEFEAAKWDKLVTPGVTLFMNVPCAHRPVMVFDRMIDAAKQLAERLHGQLLDQDRRPLSDRGIAVIHRQIEEIEERMRAFGVTAGSESALRLFGTALTQAVNESAYEGEAHV